jgi:hypothetical protein
MEQKLIRKIKENIPLRLCQKGDKISLGRYPMRGASRYMSGSIIIEKIKPIKSGMVQLKYQSQYGCQNKIHKIDLGGESTVERTRDWVESDGEDAGYYEPTFITLDGIRYRIAHPKEMEDLPARHAHNLKERENQRRAEQEAILTDPLYFGLDAGAYMGIIANFLDARITKVAAVPQLTSDSEMKRVTDSKKVTV